MQLLSPLSPLYCHAPLCPLTFIVFIHFLTFSLYVFLPRLRVSFHFPSFFPFSLTDRQ